jgi:uncharacterized glyoxalase superfamily protein PhnB
VSRQAIHRWVARYRGGGLPWEGRLQRLYVDATVAQWSAHGASAHRSPKTIMTGERLRQMLDPFGNLFGLRQPPA